MERLDVFLVKNGYYPTRNKAQNAIFSGDIQVNDKVIISPSYLIKNESKIMIISNSLPYVSRGGLKMEKALREFGINVSNYKVLDIGASTGGFTDCLLQNGASLVYALDVGSNQLHESLKNDMRVISVENSNFRNIDPEEYKKHEFDLIVADVSFISLTYVVENISKILPSSSIFVALIKPQFETMHKDHNKNGLVNDPKKHFEIIENIIRVSNKYNLFLNKLITSPIKGDKSGNIEYLGLFSFKCSNITTTELKRCIDKSFNK